MTTIHYLEMLSPAELRHARVPDGEVVVSRTSPPDGEFNRSMYVEVGRDWNWTDRLPWTDEQWSEYANRKGLESWKVLVDNKTAGYFELAAEANGNVQVAYFGILSEFIGRGIGGHLLTHAVEQAWAVPHAKRVWLHTCTDDHPHALDNYKARGFCVYRTAQETA